VNPAYLTPLANHLWQSSLFAAIIGSLTLTLRNNRARVRHWIWLAASWKFLIPFSVLISLGGHIQRPAAPNAPTSNLSIVMNEMSQPFTVQPTSPSPISAGPVATRSIRLVPGIIWACGFLWFSYWWCVDWRRIQAAVRAGTPVRLELPIQAVSSPAMLEPGIFGVFRPVLLLPEGIFYP
jgi:bla regulator protein BlaR1